MENIWVKRPGTGEIKAKDYEKLINKIAKKILIKIIKYVGRM